MVATICPRISASPEGTRDPGESYWELLLLIELGKVCLNMKSSIKMLSVAKEDTLIF